MTTTEVQTTADAKPEARRAEQDARVERGRTKAREYIAYLEERGPVPAVRDIVVAFEVALDGLYQLDEWAGGFRQILDFCEPTPDDFERASDLLDRIRSVSAILSARAESHLCEESERLGAAIGELVDIVTGRRELESEVTYRQVERWMAEEESKLAGPSDDGVAS